MSYYDRDKAQNNSSSTVHVGNNLGWPRPHLGHVGEYQASGFPYAQTVNVTTTTADDIWSVSFPYITRWVILHGHRAGNAEILPDKVLVAFNQHGFDNGAYIDLKSIDGQRLELKCSRVFFKFLSDDTDHIEILAGLTNISRDQMSGLETVDTTTNGGNDILGFNTVNTAETVVDVAPVN
jgi:hypothetical protein